MVILLFFCLVVVLINSVEEKSCKVVVVVGIKGHHTENTGGEGGRKRMWGSINIIEPFISTSKIPKMAQI